MEIRGRHKEWYETAMVCEKGHTITDGVERFPEKQTPFTLGKAIQFALVR